MNTYLIVGTINYFIDKEVKKIIKDHPKITFDLECDTLHDLINEASFSSLFNDQKYIIVKNSKLFYAGKKGEDSTKIKKEMELLQKYLENENKNVHLIFILDKKPDSKKKITKIISDNNNYIEIKSLTKTEMKNELKQYIEVHKYKIDDNSLWYIINNSLNNFDICIKEIEKLMIFYSNPTYIKYDDVLSLVCKNIKDNNYDLIDSIMERKLNESLINLKIIKLYKVDPIVIFMGLASEIRKTYKLFLLQKNKVSFNEILKELNAYDFQLKKYESYLRIYNETELKSLLLSLNKYDFILKSKNIDKELLLYKYIIENCE